METDNQMEYLKVAWIHDFEDDPILYYVEVDEQRYETRKIQIYRDNSFGLVSKNFEFGGAMLSPEPTPSFDHIKADPQFIPKIIARGEFEEAWTEYNNFLKSGNVGNADII